MNDDQVLDQAVLEVAELPVPPVIRMQRPEAYYDTGRKDYWILDNRGDWITLNETGLKRQLRGLGFSTTVPHGQTLSDLDQCLNTIQLEFNVAYGGPLAGCEKGVSESCGHRILVTTSPKLIEPRQGEFPILHQFLQNLLGPQQLAYMDGWVKVAYESLSMGHIRPGQMLVFAGEANSGKSLLQNVITRILGGRAAKPYRYMSGSTDFNGELFGAEHLMIEDEVASTDFRARRNFGSRIKDFTVNEVQSCHAKNRQAISLRPFWRVSLSVNEEPENLMILPPLDDSLADKIMLLRVSKSSMPMSAFTIDERKRFWDTLLTELPAYLWHLVHWEIPRELRCERFGIKHFHHPVLLEALQELSPQTKLLAIIDASFQEGILPTGGFHGTAESLQKSLCELSLHRMEARQLLTWPNAAAVYLARLVDEHPERVSRERTATQRTWRIKPPDGLTPSQNGLDFSQALGPLAQPQVR